MKTPLIIFVAAFLMAPSLSAKNFSHREKRLNAKTSFKIDKRIVNPTTVNETLFNEVKPEKTLRTEVRQEKTIRADHVGREPVLKATAKPKQRRNTHIREWP